MKKIMEEMVGGMPNKNWTWRKK